MKLNYPYMSNGYTAHGERIPDIPIAYLMIKAGRFRAHGPAVIDTGFDGGVYPNIEIIRIFEGLEPKAKVNFENPLFGISEFEVYSAEAFLYDGIHQIALGEVRVYIPTEPELITGDVLLGREIIQRIKQLTLNNQEMTSIIEL